MSSEVIIGHDGKPRCAWAGAGNTAWSDAGVIVPWVLYERSGDAGAEPSRSPDRKGLMVQVFSPAGVAPSSRELPEAVVSEGDQPLIVHQGCGLPRQTEIRVRRLIVSGGKTRGAAHCEGPRLVRRQPFRHLFDEGIDDRERFGRSAAPQGERGAVRDRPRHTDGAPRCGGPH